MSHCPRLELPTRLMLVALSATALFRCLPALSANSYARTPTSELAPIVISGRRLPPNASDEQVTQAVTESIAEDPWILSEHVTVYTRDGVVYIEGVVTDEWDLYHILDHARKIAGRRKIVNDLDFQIVGFDGN